MSEPIFITADRLPEAWERSIQALWARGRVMDTEYGERSKDSPAVIYVREPLEEPRVHLKGVVSGTLRGLFHYVSEVVEGVSDWRVGRDWHYTYHERLFAYDAPCSEPVDQIRLVVDKLRKAPYSRRAQAVTWKPWIDPSSDSPPCIQRTWFRVIDGRLALHVHVRSNDALKAAFMNMYAFTELQRLVAEKVGVEAGYYLHVADSYHIYERDWKWVGGFVGQIEKGVSRRYWLSTEQFEKIALREEK